MIQLCSDHLLEDDGRLLYPCMIAPAWWPRGVQIEIWCRRVNTVVAKVIYQLPSMIFVEVSNQEMTNRGPLHNRYYMWLVARNFAVRMYHSSQTIIHGAAKMSDLYRLHHAMSKISYTPRGNGSSCNIRLWTAKRIPPYEAQDRLAATPVLWLRSLNSTSSFKTRDLATAD
jgi:hypothetical protein